MKKPLLPVLLFSLVGAQVAQASEVRNLSAICKSKDGALSLSFFAHSDILKSGKVDVLVKITGSMASTYLVNDVAFQAVKGEGDFSHALFTDGDVTLDLTVDNDRKTASLVMDADGTKLPLVCRTID